MAVGRSVVWLLALLLFTWITYDVFTQIVNSDIPYHTFNNSRHLCWCNGRYMPVYVINTLGILYIDSIINTDAVSGYYNVSCVDDTWSSYHERQASAVLSGISSKNDQYFSAYKIHSFNILTLREKMGGHLDEISISLTNLNSHRADYSIDSFNKHRQYLLTSAVYSLKDASNLRLKSKRLKKPISYYNNSSATHILLLIIAGVEQNPGPISKNKSRETQRKAPRCTVCEKPAASNHKRFICEVCHDLTHARCLVNITINLKSFSAASPKTYTCEKCLYTVLPFWNANITDTTISESEYEVTQDEDSSVLHAKSEQLRIMHLNTQSMVSTFDEFILTINQFPFDIITLSETWLKDNRHLLDYVSIPGYVNLFRNRDIIRGGGVGIYLRDNIKFKLRKDIEKLQPDMEHYLA